MSMNGWRKACRVLAILVAVGLAVLVGVRKKGEQPDETDESSVLAEGPAVWQSIEGFVSESGEYRAERRRNFRRNAGA